MTFVKPNKTEKQNQTDMVMTPIKTAKLIVDYFKPIGSILEPAKGTGNFYKLFNQPKDWCEITKGRDFFNQSKKFDWIITNPPYSIYDKFLLKCFEIADNIVLLIPLAKVFKSRKIDNEIVKYGGIKEILMIGSGSNAGFNFGFPIGAVYFKRNYKKNIIKITRKYI